MVSDHRFPSLCIDPRLRGCGPAGQLRQGRAELDTTSASVSYHVRRLEQQIGVPLFVRHPNHVVLTEAGEIVAHEAMNAFAALARELRQGRRCG